MTMAYEAIPAEELAQLEASHPGSRWMRPVEVIAAALLVAMITMILTNVASRYVFARPIIWADEIASMSFL